MKMAAMTTPRYVGEMQPVEAQGDLCYRSASLIWQDQLRKSKVRSTNSVPLEGQLQRNVGEIEGQAQVARALMQI